MELELEEPAKPKRHPHIPDGFDYRANLAEVHEKWVNDDSFRCLEPGYVGSSAERDAAWRIRSYKRAIDEYDAFDRMMAGKYGDDWKDKFKNGSGTRN